MITIRWIDVSAALMWLTAVILGSVNTAAPSRPLGTWAVIVAVAACSLTSAAYKCRLSVSRQAGVEEGLRMAGIVRLSDHERI